MHSIYIFFQLFHSYVTLWLGHHNKLVQTERKSERERQCVKKSGDLLNDLHQPVEGKRTVSEVLYYTAVPQTG